MENKFIDDSTMDTVISSRKRKGKKEACNMNNDY